MNKILNFKFFDDGEKMNKWEDLKARLKQDREHNGIRFLPIQKAMEHLELENPDPLSDIEKMVEYLIADEAKHFDECQPDEKKDHIYQSIERVHRWLERGK